MKKAFCMLPLVALVSILLFGLSGCGFSKFITTGDGWINSVEGAKKATFGFNAQITVTDPDDQDSDYDIKGHFQYNDHGAGYQLRGKIMDFVPIPLEDLLSLFPDFPDFSSLGVITFLPAFEGITNDGMPFYVIAWDGDIFDEIPIPPEEIPPGIPPDILAVIVLDDYGIASYANWGYLGDGDIQFAFEPELVPEE